MKQFAINLKKLRQEVDLSFRRLAKAIGGISHNNLAAYERGDIVPSFNNVIKICKYFNVPVEYLLTGKKVNSVYNDLELLELFSQVDELDDDYRNMVKEYIIKVITNAKEKDELKKEIKK